ncbi:Smr/MutS family protein [Roseovarius salis]|uniref:Smr/MutS family protein n=1 Tax=Roseovarius salis TaxID=3376063 RepID=UPI0037C5DA63
MSRRKLRPDELELWHKVARTTERLHPDTPRREFPIEKRQDTPTDREHVPVRKFEIGETSNQTAKPHDVLPGLSERLAGAPVRMDKKAHGRLKRGKLMPEGRIDLHGMTLDQAHPTLTAFLMKSHARGRRLVLVITGKGKRSADDGPIPERPGALRHAVPRWLQSPPLAQIVLQITEAHARHGGGGAYYVYLRRKR